MGSPGISFKNLQPEVALFLNSLFFFLHCPSSYLHWNLAAVSFIGRLFRHALEESRPKSVLVNLLGVCISLLDPKRLTTGVYYMYNRQTSLGPGAAANPETVRSMLEGLGNLGSIFNFYLRVNS